MGGVSKVPAGDTVPRLNKNGNNRKNNYSVILQKLADGMTQAEISDELKITRQTTTNILRRLRKTYGVYTNFQLLAHALRNGWID